MADIEEARKVAGEFLKRTINARDGEVIKVTKVSDGWETEVEVYEESSFIKALGLPTRVQDRNVYAVKLNNNLGVESFERKEAVRPE